MIKEIEELIKKEADEMDWKFHIKPVLNNALFLAKKLNADKEIVELSALLHDLGRLKHGPENHDITGVSEAKKVLDKFNYSEEKKQKVFNCIRTHRAKKDNLPKTIEAKIIANADAMAHFDAFLYLLCQKNDDFISSLKWVESKIKRDWETKLTLPEAQKMVKDKHEAITLNLNSIKKLI